METKGTSNEELLQLGITAAKRKNFQNARMLLLQVYERDKRNETAMMWLAKIAPTREERISWLERVVEEVNPDNEVAKKGLEQLRYKQAADENRTLLLFGGVAVFMILLVFLIIFVVVNT